MSTINHPSRVELSGNVTSQSPQVITTYDLQCREALSLWSRWNEEYERLTERMYRSQGQPEAIEALLDQLDHLRHMAAEMSRNLLDDPARS